VINNDDSYLKNYINEDINIIRYSKQDIDVSTHFGTMMFETKIYNETIMVNNNPEAVSTDCATADKLYLEPMSAEDILNIVETEKPYAAVTQYAGKKSKELTKLLESEGIKIFGASSEVMELTDNKVQFNALLDELSIPHRSYKYAKNASESLEVALK
ncbi:MAG: hypothetical protein RSD17_04705, partial [Oscillospiraceae bacterium]